MGRFLIWGTEIFLIRKYCRLSAVCGTFRAPHATFVYVIFIIRGAAFYKPVRSSVLYCARSLAKLCEFCSLMKKVSDFSYSDTVTMLCDYALTFLIIMWDYVSKTPIPVVTDAWKEAVGSRSYEICGASCTK
jgi:hypothetical protein